MSHGSPTLVIPEHELLRPIASGSYGEVWLANSAVGTLRAVKIVRRDRFERNEDFEREFRGLQQFEPVSRAHEGLIDILQIGRQEDWFYYVMELADDAGGWKEESRDSKEPQNPKPELKPVGGETRASGPGALSDHYSPLTLRQMIRQRGFLAADEVILIGRTLASALQHLHTQGLVHRDVKPSNILFVDGRPKLADAGLVAPVDDARSLVGTHGYIPPEGPGKGQADIYSLGKVLYEAAFGKDRQEFPQLPSDLAERPDHGQLLELNELIVKACARDPRQRYPNVEAMLFELDLLQRGQSVRRAHLVSHRWNLVRVAASWGIPAALILTVLTIVARRPAPANLENSKRSSNKAAQDAYDIGRRYLRENDEAGISNASRFFLEAVNADTNFALARAALAATWCYPDVGTNRNYALLPRAREMAEQALKRDDTFSEAHLALGWHAALAERDWPKATQYFENALRLDPNNSQAHEWYGVVLKVIGETNEAIGHLERAVALDPTSPAFIRHYGLVLLAARRYSEAVGRFGKCVQLQPIPMNLSGLQDALIGDGQIDRAIDVSVEIDKLNGSDPAQAEAMGQELHRAYREGGMAEFHRKRLESSTASNMDPLERAGLLAMAGRSAEALDLLDRAYATQNISLVWDLKTGAQWDGLRSEQRFKDLLKRMHLD